MMLRYKKTVASLLDGLSWGKLAIMLYGGLVEGLTCVNLEADLPKPANNA